MNYVKKFGAAFIAILMLVAVLPMSTFAAVPEAYALPDGVTADTWEYRELVPDLECETLTGFENRGSSDAAPTLQTNVVLDSVNKNYGESSLKRTARYSTGIGFRTAGFEAGATYNVSAAMRSDLIRGDAVMKIRPFLNYISSVAKEEEGVVTAYTRTEGFISGSTEWSVDNSWKEYKGTFTIPTAFLNSSNASASSGALTQIGLAYNQSSGTANDLVNNRIVDTMYVDDWSIRKVPTGDFANVASEIISVKAGTEASAANNSEAPVTVKNGNLVEFEFTLDIDPRTVRKEKILVNGTANSNIITSAVLTEPTGTTRRTVLTLMLGNMAEGAIYNISFDGLKDAWGREVVGNAAAYVMTAAEKPYSINDDLDSSGLWKYRELVPDSECETLTGFENRASSDSTSTLQTSIELSENAHSGNYSIARTARQYAGVGFKDDIFEAGKTFHISAYLRSDLIRETDTMPIRPFLGNYYVYSTSSSKYNVTEGWISGSPQFYVNDTWQRFEGTFTIPANAVKAADAGISNPKPMQIGLSNNLDSVTGATANDINNRIVDRMYVDDWSIRLIPDWTVNAKGYSAKGSTVEFYFDKDIDKWTAQAKDITVTGGATVSNVEVSTDEITRKTTLSVTLSGTAVGEEYTVTLPSGIKDAWGRELSNVEAATFTVPEISATVNGNTYSYVINKIKPAGENWVAAIALKNSGRGLEQVVWIPDATAADAALSGSFADYEDGDKIIFYLWTSDFKPIIEEIEN
ncbi:MAG: hypothetical protein IKW59_06840 [Clostridia bacterium]|nr:hypothetical protein [Clostridia bacterium]